MDMEYIDPYHRPYSAMAMHPYGGQQLAHPQEQQHPYWNQLMAYYQQQQRAAALMGQGSMHLSKPTEPKPRLAKDEVELLEQEFAKNPKPSSSTKRELAEQMGVEVPRINNWFQNRRAKEKQMRKTAEFEAQQARERVASESKSIDDQEQGPVSEFYGLNNQHQPLGLSTASFGNDGDAVESDGTAAERQSVDPAAPPAGASPASSDGHGFVQVKNERAASPVHPAQGMSELPPSVAITGSFGETHVHTTFPQPTTFAFRPVENPVADGLPRADFNVLASHNRIEVNDRGTFNLFRDQDYFATPSLQQFPSEMVGASPTDLHMLRHQVSTESLARSDAVSPTSMPESPSTVPALRFKSPPPPADIAGRRKMRRPAPLGLPSLRGMSGPKTGIEGPRRADTASPMRRISSSTGPLCGRVQKTSIGPGGPRSPFALDRNKEALLQSLQGTQGPILGSLNNAMPPMSPSLMGGHGVGEGVMGTNASDDEQGYPFSSYGGVNRLPSYNGEPAARSPPDTPGLQTAFHESYFPTSLEQAWNFVPQDEPLPTPSLCSHGGSELEFSMAPQLPGYVASQPVTPSFPPATVGPTYAGYFGTSLGHNTEYQFPDSYPTESSARSSPVAPPRSKQFQFAQNVTPQDFSTDRP